MKQILFFVSIAIVLMSCQSNQSSKPITENTSNSHEVVVREVMQVGSYTYLFVKENGNEFWVATTPIEAKVGETYYYEGGFEMKNFKSKELNRVFESIIFLEGISAQPIGTDANGEAVSPGATQAKSAKLEINISPAEGTITIAELFSNKSKYAGKTVKVKAQVTKFSPEIMDKNWIHLQDGTQSEGDFDLTVTSKETVKEGDIVIFEGSITLDKDLGFGYFFKVLMEDASLVKGV